MGHFFAELELSNPRQPDLRTVRVRALADTGALMLCLPEHVALQLELETEAEREVTVADGRKQKVPYVGPIKVKFENRSCFVGALVLGDEVLLGAVPMEDMDLVVSRGRRSITVDPTSPNIPHARVKATLAGNPALVARLRRRFAHLPAGVSLAEELIAERRPG
jgi:clan AA aspartic protease